MDSRQDAQSRHNHALMEWNVPASNPAQAEALCGRLSIPPLLARILVGRGFADCSDAEAFLRPSLSRLHDPFTIPDMLTAVERAARAVHSKEKIAVFGDYDVDGLTSTALLLRMFKFLGIEARWHIPHRLLEGYGMSAASIEALHKDGVSLIITVDNGVTSFSEIALACAMGIDVIVTDHHMPSETLPAAVAVVDPNRSDSQYPCSCLAGVGVAFKFVHALLKFMKVPDADARRFLFESLDLVGIGTISDIVPLIDENRVLAHCGLQQARVSEKSGFKALRDTLGLHGEALTPRAIGFIIGPRINAAGRTGYADTALELLVTEDDARAKKIVESLGLLNDERRRIENEILTEAIERVESDPALREDPVLVVEGNNWHHGVIGIVASRLLSQYDRPVVVLGVDGELVKGSARSLSGFDIVQSLGACSEHLLGFGGHSLAAGLQMRHDRIKRFREALNEYARKQFEICPLRHCLEIDAEASLAELTCECCESLSMLEPIGADNPRPMVALRNLQLAEPPRMVGRSSEHLRVTLSSNGCTLPGIGFNLTQSCRWLFEATVPVDIAGTPCINEYNGRRSAQIEIRDIRPSQMID